MAAKSIVDIEINDDKFKEFFALFDKYHKQLDSMNKKWDQLSNQGKKLKEGVGKLNVDGLDKSAQKATKDMQKLNESAKQTDKSLKSIKSTSKDINKEFFTLNQGLSKFFGGYENSTASSFGLIGKVVGVAAGLTLGAAFAVHKMAGVAVGAQKTARSNNMTSGQVRAYETDYSRLSDMSLISKITNAQFDPEQQVYLMMASGAKSIGEVQRANPADLASKIMMKVHDFMKGVPPELRNSAVASAGGFPQLGITAQDMNLWMNTPKEEHIKALNDYNKDKKDLNISDSSTGKFFEASRQMEIAEKRIVGKLIEKLDDASLAVADFVKALEEGAEKILNWFRKPDPNAPNPWETSLPDELKYLRKPAIPQSTQSSIDNIFDYSWKPGKKPTGPSQRNVGVTIYNATGSNIATSVNGAAT